MYHRLLPLASVPDLPTKSREGCWVEIVTHGTSLFKVQVVKEIVRIQFKLKTSLN